MKTLNFKPILQSLFFIILAIPSWGMDKDKADIHAHITDQSQIRKNKLWQPLQQQNTELTHKANVVFGKKIGYDTTHNNLKRAIHYLDAHKTTKNNVAVSIPYILCTSNDVADATLPPKGVIIKVYGSTHSLKLEENLSLQEEQIWAAQDYLVYILNLRGTAGFGPNFHHLEEEEHAVQSQIRDISYFTYLLKNNKKDIRGKTPKGSHLIESDVPFFLMGASYGGYLSLYHATNPEDDFYIKQYKVSLSHRSMFDGYMASMPVTDVWRDIKSGTTTGNKRLSFFIEDQKDSQHSWMTNIYHHKNIVDNDEHRRDLSPNFRMSNRQKPLLFLHGAEDDNVSPKQTIDCIKEAIEQKNENQIFLYFDNELGHSFPTFTLQTKRYYEMMFRFMDGVSHATKNGTTLSSYDSLPTINALAYIRFRALNPDVSRPPYQFFYEAIKVYHQGKNDITAFDQFWEFIKNIKSDFYLKSLVWLKEKNWMKEKKWIEFKRPGNRIYLEQKKSMKLAYSIMLKKLNIRDITCGTQPHRTLKDYFSKMSRVKLSSHLSHLVMSNDGIHKVISHYDRLMHYLGDDDHQLGQQHFEDFNDELKKELNTILCSYPSHLIIHPPALTTRLGY